MEKEEEMNETRRSYSVLVIIAFTIGIFNSGFFSNPDTAIQAVHEHKYTNAQVINHSWFFLALRPLSVNGYFSRFTVEAWNSSRESVTLLVYTGWLYDPVVQIVHKK